VGVVHVRDSLTAERSSTARDLMRSLLRFDADEPVHAVLRTMRESRTHLAVVQSADTGDIRGVVTLSDVVDRLLPGTVGSTS
ncbi:CBS domain-containing protein, partial [Williamsia sp.]|uniref:CBS domain-containing protein n=1 Tax=Williamsia sp. TaxID=1872085 RepID=UPI001A2512F3